MRDVFDEPWRVGHWTIVSIGDGYHCEVFSTPRRTEIEQGDILWVHAYLRSESVRWAPHDPRMYRYVEERSTEGEPRCPMTLFTHPGPKA